ncbi:flagellar motor switch protein FliN, partial [Thermoproteota archaeon]
SGSKPAKSSMEEVEETASVSEVQFPTLTQEAMGRKVEADIFSNIPVRLSVELGRTEISLKEVLELSEGSIIELERLVGEPLDLVVNGQIVAQGEVVAIDNNYGFRVTNLISTVQQL